MTEDARSQTRDAVDVLSLDHVYRPYGEDELDDIFIDMRTALETKGEKDDEEIRSGFCEATRNIGTHGPKLVNSRIKQGGFNPENSEPEFRPQYSGDAKYIPYAKVLLRPIEIKDASGTESFFERMRAQQNSAAQLESSFERVFGAPALNAIKRAFVEQPKNFVESELHTENFPIVFIPGPNGDLTTTPVAAFHALRTMQKIKDEGKAQPGVHKTAQDQGIEDLKGTAFSLMPIGRYLRAASVDNPQNISSGTPKTLIRFHSEMPRTLTHYEAAIHAFRRGGRFPPLRDHYLAARIEHYANLLEKVAETTLAPSAMTKIDKLADWIIRDGQAFIEEIIEASSVDVDAAPAIEAVVKTAASKKYRTRSIAALSSDHFRARVRQVKLAR